MKMKLELTDLDVHEIVQLAEAIRIIREDGEVVARPAKIANVNVKPAAAKTKPQPTLKDGG